MTTIERMAQAMLAAEHREVGYSGDIEPLWNELSKTDRARLCLYARAALEALQGEGMEEAHKGGVRCLATNDCKCTVMGGVPMPCHYHSVRATQFLEAAAPLIRAPLVARIAEVEAERDRQYDENVGQIAKYAALEAEVETLRGDMVKLIAARMEDNRESDARLLTAEARVQRLEEVGRELLNAEAWDYTTGRGQRTMRFEAAIAEFRSLLPEETTNE